MAEIHEQIKEIEDEMKKLIKMAGSISIERRGYIQQKAITRFANGCRELQCWHLGELKNAFEMGIMKG